MRGARSGIVLLTVACLLLAGCGGSGGGDVVTTTFTKTLQSGKGGIQGLLVDDVYRPVPAATVYLLPIGLSATTDSAGEFSFVDLDPGAYTLKMDEPAHEASPANVDVEANQYTEVEFNARRLVSLDGRIITTFYSVFVPCAFGVVEASYTVDCTGDTSGDSYRAFFLSDYTTYGDNITYLVTEMRSSQKASSGQGAYKVVVRDGETSGDPYYTSGFILDSDYLKLTMKLGEISPDDAEPGRNQNWTNDRVLETSFFPQGAFKAETQMVLDAGCGVTGQTCFESRGLGPQLGIKATFIQSAFLGEPKDPIADYHTMQAS